MKYTEIDGEKYQVPACTPQDCPFYFIEEDSFTDTCNHPKAWNYSFDWWNGTNYPKDCPLREEEE